MIMITHLLVRSDCREFSEVRLGVAMVLGCFLATVYTSRCRIVLLEKDSMIHAIRIVYLTKIEVRAETLFHRDNVKQPA